MADYTNLSDVVVDGDIVASRKLKGGQQAINEGDAVLLTASGKIPPEFVDVNVDLSGYVTIASFTQTLSNYVTTAGLNSTLGSYVTDSELSAQLGSYVTDSELDQKLAGTSTGQAYTKVWRGTLAGNGSSTSLSATHNLGVVPSVTIYKNGELYFTDVIVTETQVTLTFATAPSANDVFTLVMIG